jgi:hypothetical protein
MKTLIIAFMFLIFGCDVDMKSSTQIKPVPHANTKERRIYPKTRTWVCMGGVKHWTGWNGMTSAFLVPALIPRTPNTVKCDEAKVEG